MFSRIQRPLKNNSKECVLAMMNLCRCRKLKKTRNQWVSWKTFSYRLSIRVREKSLSINRPMSNSEKGERNWRLKWPSTKKNFKTFRRKALLKLKKLTKNLMKGKRNINKNLHKKSWKLKLSKILWKSNRMIHKVKRLLPMWPHKSLKGVRVRQPIACKSPNSTYQKCCLTFH